jgi:hypothetical protein
MTNPDSDRDDARKDRISIRVSAALIFLVLSVVAFYAYVTLAFGISYREPVSSIVQYGTALFAVLLILGYLGKTIWTGVFPRFAFSLRALLLISISYSVWICLLVAYN